jgi:hypothetical protein
MNRDVVMSSPRLMRFRLPNFSSARRVHLTFTERLHALSQLRRVTIPSSDIAAFFCAMSKLLTLWISDCPDFLDCPDILDAQGREDQLPTLRPLPDESAEARQRQLKLSVFPPRFRRLSLSLLRRWSFL